jgi:cell division protein FtsN
MKDDYLWDRSGQPDPEIQQLEDLLGELRYQPRPLEIPADLKTGGNRFQFSRYAIAAAVAMMVLGVGAWLAIQKQNTQVVTAPQSQPAEVKTVTPEEPKRTAVVAPAHETVAAVRETPRRIVRVKSHRSRTTRTPQLSSEELAEAVAAKERLMLALRLASSKLNYAQKKAQGSNPPPVYHQHKIG